MSRLGRADVMERGKCFPVIGNRIVPKASRAVIDYRIEEHQRIGFAADRQILAFFVESFDQSATRPPAEPPPAGSDQYPVRLHAPEPSGWPISAYIWYTVDKNNKLTPIGNIYAMWSKNIKPNMVRVSGPAQTRCFAIHDPKTGELSAMIVNQPDRERTV
jgi:hypothetical protein